MKYSSIVLGLGNIGLMYDFDDTRPHPSSHTLAYVLHPDIKLLYGVDVDVNKKHALKQLAPEATFVELVDDTWKKEYVDIVSICTPPRFHFDNIKTVLSELSPKVVFCEKPLVSDLTEANALITYLKKNECGIVIPNISRRWNMGLRAVRDIIANKRYGDLIKIHIKYTRGIFNTGAHMFDLLNMWTEEKIAWVQSMRKVYTSSEREGEPSYSFFFEQTDGVYGYAEAMNDEDYYVFEIELFFSKGKIFMRNSGDDVFFYRTSAHHLFSGYSELSEDDHWGNLLHDSCLGNAIEDIVRYLDTGEPPQCSLHNAIYPLYVAKALEKSYLNNGRKEAVKNV